MNKLFYKRKAVLSSIFVCLLLILVSTIVPTINGSYTNEIINDVENNILNKEKYNKIIENFNNGIFNLIQDDLSYELFFEFYNSIDSSKFINNKFIGLLIIEFITLFKQINKNTYKNEIENKNFKVNDNINYLQYKNLGFINDITYDDNFTSYWMKYEETVNFWHEENPSIKSFQEWFNDIDGRVNNIEQHYLFQILISFVLCFIGAFGIKFVSIIGWIVLAFVLYQVFNFIKRIVDGYNYYTSLKIREVEILVHIKGNTTGPEKDGINDLWQDKRVVAINTDAIEECDGSIGKTEDLFTYYLGPAIGVNNTGINESGWYSLKNRNKAEGEDNDYKAPLPPGNWSIEAKYSPDWDGSGVKPVGFITRKGILIYEITLEPRQI